jgi:hypothetical protein
MQQIAAYRTQRKNNGKKIQPVKAGDGRRVICPPVQAEKERQYADGGNDDNRARTGERTPTGEQNNQRENGAQQAGANDCPAPVRCLPVRCQGSSRRLNAGG